MNIAEFTAGNRYEDFDSNIDEVAAWGIGGLIAGKVLLKTGAVAAAGAGIFKFLKIIIIGIGALFAGLFKFFKKKKEDQSYVYEQTPAAPPAEENTPNV